METYDFRSGCTFFLLDFLVIPEAGSTTLLRELSFGFGDSTPQDLTFATLVLVVLDTSIGGKIRIRASWVHAKHF